MKKISKLLIVHCSLLIAILGMASCSSSDDYEPGKPAGKYNVGFADESKQVLSLKESSFDVTLTRKGTDGSLTVPITVVNAEGFDVPSSATFKDGDSTAVFTVKCPDDMAVCTDYTFTIRIPEEYTNPYSNTAYSPLYNVKVAKEDYQEYAAATYYDDFYYGEEWDVTVEYSETMDLYRVPSLYADGYPLYFKWNKKKGTVQIVASDGGDLDTFVSGLADDDYPSYFAKVSKSEAYYDKNEKAIVFDFYWGCADGYWGNGYPGYLYVE